MKYRTAEKVAPTGHKAGAGSMISWRYAVPLWLIGAVILAAVNQYRNGPATLADELGYLGIARWLANAGPLPNMFDASFYHFGYSFLIAPAFWLGGNPVSVYRWVMIINCALAATVAPLGYVFARKWLAVEHKQALFLAAIAMLYPANAVQTNFAWSENALPALLLCWSIALVLVHERPTPLRLVFLALLPVALFFVHPRMLGIELVTLTYLAIKSATEKSGRLWYLASCAVMILAHAVVAHLLSHVRHLAYEANPGSIRNFMQALHHAFSNGMKLPAAAAGQLTYLSYGSGGLIVIGIMALAIMSVQQYRNMRTQHTILSSTFANPSVILATGIASIFAASAVTMSGGVRVDHWLYGRYADAASAILLIAGTYTALNKKHIRALAPWLVVILCFSVTLWFTYATITIPDGVVYNNIPTLAPLLHALQNFAGTKQIAFAVIMLLVLVPALLWAAAGKRAAAPIITMYAVCSIMTIVEWPKHLVGHDAYPNAVRQAREDLAHADLSQKTIFVYRDSLSDPSFVAMFYRMQYYLDKNPITLVDRQSKLGPCPQIGMSKEIASSLFARGKTIQLSNKIVFWIPENSAVAMSCK